MAAADFRAVLPGRSPGLRTSRDQFTVMLVHMPAM